MSGKYPGPRGSLLAGVSVVLVLMLAVLWLMASSSKGPPPHKLDEIVPAPSPKLEPLQPAVDLYIDASQSMQGFVTQPNSAFSRVLRQLLIASTSSGYDINTYRFASPIVPVNHIVVNELLSPNFYIWPDTPLTSLMDRISSKENQSRISVVVTDMVQSQRGVDQLALVRAFRNLAESKPEVLLLGFRSGFRGPFFVETGAKGKFDITLPETPDNGRPFYVFVVAPSVKALDQFEHLCLAETRSLVPVKSFRPSDPALMTKNIEFVPVDEKNSRSTLDAYGPPKKDGSRWLASFREREKPRSLTEDLQVRFTTDVQMKLIALERLDFRVTKKLPSTKIQFVADVTLKPQVRGRADGSAFVVTYPFVRPNEESWDVYQIQMLPGVGNLTVPDWVAEWDTEDDSRPQNGSKTLYLRLMVQCMVRAITENTAIAEQIIQVGRRS